MVKQSSLKRANGGVRSELGNLLNQIRLVDIFVGAWNKSRELRKYSDPKKYPPDEANFVPLVEHTITSTHQPYLAARSRRSDRPRAGAKARSELRERNS